jgi:hypothetical protein
MKRSLFFRLALTIAPLAIGGPAMAAELFVAQGCNLPKGPGGGHEFYIDPVHGAMSNDGSKERPWRTLAEVLAPSSHLISSFAYANYAKGDRTLKPVNPQGPVKAGDTLVLMTGDHGDVDLRQYENRDFIYVVAGKDQTPRIAHMMLIAASHWYFKGLKFQGVRPEKDIHGAMVEVGYSDYAGPTDNIVFAGNSFSTEDSVASWTDADWVNKPYTVAFQTKTRCTTLFSNHFYHVRDAARISGDDTVAASNLVENMGNDGFDIMASNLTISHNIIRSGHHTPLEPLHADGVQGWTLNDKTNRNVRIEGNFVTDLNQSDNNYMQGISIFDGKWDGVEIVDNVVVTNTWHGIALYGVVDARVINNTVLPSRPEKIMTWITILPRRKDKTPSSNVVVRNNIAGQIVVDGQRIEVDHNVALRTVRAPKSGNGEPIRSDFVLANNFTNVSTDSLFIDFSVAQKNLNLRLAPRSLASGAGSPDGAPATDIEGRPRTPPVDIGAYQH